MFWTVYSNGPSSRWARGHLLDGLSSKRDVWAGPFTRQLIEQMGGLFYARNHPSQTSTHEVFPNRTSSQSRLRICVHTLHDCTLVTWWYKRRINGHLGTGVSGRKMISTSQLSQHGYINEKLAVLSHLGTGCIMRKDSHRYFSN